ncbi:MAG: hypothetical protein J6S42_07935, partial [Thermoguttaceae bacterium]|nr:hypothetical protein [Thermoguttaceae bacterium]
MKKRVLRFESLEDRQLLAVTAGLEAAAALPAPTEAAPAGYRVGDVYIASTDNVISPKNDVLLKTYKSYSSVPP